MSATAALAVALKEVATPAFCAYGQQIVKNAVALAQALIARGYDPVTGGTDNHMLVLDLRDHPFTARDYASRLAAAGIITRFNMAARRPGSLRRGEWDLPGSPAVTPLRAEDEMNQIASFIDQIRRKPENLARLRCMRPRVAQFCDAFGPPGVEVP